MTKDTIKTPKGQVKQAQRELLQAKQDEWQKKANDLQQKKAKIGLNNLSWKDFMEEVPDDSYDSAFRSAIISTQNEYKELQEEQKLLFAKDNVVEEFNKKHAVVHIDQTYILTEKINAMGCRDFSLESRPSFRAFYEDETILCIDGVERCKADIWLKSPKRRKYRGIIFDPTTTEASSEYYNLWHGFAKNAQQGNCSKYWQHVKENICNNNLEAYEYLRKWLAIVFQRPDEVHTAIVLCGSQGVGKNSFVEPLGVLLGTHYAPLSSISELVSNFNYHLKNAVLIHANEALWGGNKKELGTLKAMVTEQTCLIEGKGKDRIVVRNFKHIILSSNEDWPVHLDPDDRRFFVVRVGEKHKEDHEYFKAIQEELSNGGYEALLFELLHEDLTNYNPRRMPSSADSFSIKMRSTDSPHRYLYEALCDGGFSIGENPHEVISVWQGIIPKDLIYKDYVLWCEKSGETALSKELFCRAIKKILITLEDRRPAGDLRARCYKFLSLEKAREEFCKAFKEKSERIFDDYEIEP